MSEMYSEPPHLMVAVYADNQPDIDTFALTCDVVQELNCTPLGLIEVGPSDQEFELLSDLGTAREILKPSPARYVQIIAGQAPELRALRVAYRHRKFGKVIVEYQQRIGPGMHPICVSLSAGPLGIPESLWSASQRRSTYAIAEWSCSVLEMTVLRCDALYGAIGVELSLPTPWQLWNKKPRLATELFVSRRLMDASVLLEGKLRQAFSGGKVSDWQNGLFFSGWAPYNLERASLGNPAIATNVAASALRSAFSGDAQ
jgi:hypothetical protein